MENENNTQDNVPSDLKSIGIFVGVFVGIFAVVILVACIMALTSHPLDPGTASLFDALTALSSLSS